jgi:Response regulator containing CheY-like receiver, AAA-type ATPase, and DNA-binding domains
MLIEASGIMLQGMSESTPAAAQAYTGSTQAGLVGRTVESVEQELIIDTLNHCLGNRTHAANILGISIRTLTQ